MNKYKNGCRLCELALHKFLSMSNELGVSARAQFMQIHSLPLTFHGNALRIDSIQKPIEPVGQGQNKAEQGRDADQLRQPLARGAVSCRGGRAAGYII